MLPLQVLLACLIVGAASKIPEYYCGLNSTDEIRDREFYIITRNSTNYNRSYYWHYPPGLTCEFRAKADTQYFFEFITFRLSTAVFTVRSNNVTLFNGSSIRGYQVAMATDSNSLEVQFSSVGDYSYRRGVEMRVRTFDPNGCPPYWKYLLGDCFGTTKWVYGLNYTDAQKACNSMRSNLMHVPASYRGDMRTFIGMLPDNLRSYDTWIGLTDKTRAGQYHPFWLSGDRQYFTSEIGCPWNSNYFFCRSFDRCGAIGSKSGPYHAMLMRHCSEENRFVCSSPPGGSSVFYPVPDYDKWETSTVRSTFRPTAATAPKGIFGGNTTAWIIGLTLSGTFILAVGLVCLYLYCKKLSSSDSPGQATQVVPLENHPNEPREPFPNVIAAK